jgi:hypothetical protein
VNSDLSLLAAKVGLSASFGAALSMKFLQGPWWQRVLSFGASLVIGCLGGGAAMEHFHIVPGSYMHMLMTASAAVFGLSFVNNAAQQIPQVIAGLRHRFLGRED